MTTSAFRPTRRGPPASVRTDPRAPGTTWCVSQPARFENRGAGEPVAA